MSWTKQQIHELLDNNPKAVMRAVVAIHARQTETEKACMATHDNNGVGFSAFDAEPMTRLAEAIQRNAMISDKWLAFGRRRIKRYWRQLIEIADEAGREPRIPTQAVEVGINPALPNDANPSRPYV